MRSEPAVGRKRQHAGCRASAVYGALFEIAAMKASLDALEDNLARSDVDRLARALESIEGQALGLLDTLEAGRPAAGH